MDVETHLVNGQKDYIRLLEGIPGRYLCWECGDLVETAAKPTLTVNQEASAAGGFSPGSARREPPLRHPVSAATSRRQKRKRF